METSIFLARVLGLFFVMSTAAILVRYKRSPVLEEKAASSPVLIHLSGFVILTLGVLLVVNHPVWTLDWRLVITITGWLVVLKGAGRILFPSAVGRAIARRRRDRRFLLGEVVVLLVGLYLLYHGFMT